MAARSPGGPSDRLRDEDLREDLGRQQGGRGVALDRSRRTVMSRDDEPFAGLAESLDATRRERREGAIRPGRGRISCALGTTRDA